MKQMMELNKMELTPLSQFELQEIEAGNPIGDFVDKVITLICWAKFF